MVGWDGVRGVGIPGGRKWIADLGHGVMGGASVAQFTGSDVGRAEG